MNQFSIELVSWQDTLCVRHAVLWPDKDPMFCKVEGDEAALHFGIADKQQLVCVASIYLDQDEARLRKFATLPAYQGNGIGTAMLAHIIDELTTRKISRLWFDARETAISFYERLGFACFSERFYKHDIPYVKMQKVLIP